MTASEQMPPNLKILLDELKAEIFATLNCVQIGKIEKVTPGAQTIEATIQIKRVAADGTSTLYPVLVDCPYLVLQGGGAYLDMPIMAGDFCLILFNDRNIDNWWKSGTAMDPDDFRKHSLSDGIALVGLNPSSKVLSQDGTWVRLLGTSGPGAEQPAARKTDTIQIDATSDAAFYAWLSAVGTATGAGAPPASILGKISGGSSEVKIG